MATQMRGGCGIALSLALLMVGCGGEAGEELVDETQPLEMPDRLTSAESLVLLRLSGGNATTSSAVHRSMAKLFTREVSVRDVLHRGGGKLPTSASDEARAAGSALDQVSLLLERIAERQEGPLPADMAVDACGNPMLAAFVTPDALAPLVPESAAIPFDEMVSRDARGDGSGVDTLQDGTWDISLTETRRDGLVDAIVQLYPAVNDERPGILGHVMAFFLTSARPGFFQAPLFLAADKVTVSISGLLQLDRIYVDPVYLDPREVYRFPHQARTVQRSDVGVTLLGDALCDVHHAAGNEAALPFGCQLDDERNLPVQLDVGSRLGSTIYEQVLNNGESTKALEQVQDALAYQVSAFLACPTLDEPKYLRDGPVEVLICPEGGADACLAQHDAEEAGCDVNDAGVFPSPTQIQAPSSTSGLTAPTLAPSRNAYEITQQNVGSDLAVALNGEAGASVELYFGADVTVSMVPPGGGADLLTDRANSHCNGRAYTVDFAETGRHILRITPTSSVSLLVVDTEDWVPPGTSF